MRGVKFFSQLRNEPSASQKYLILRLHFIDNEYIEPKEGGAQTNKDEDYQRKINKADHNKPLPEVPSEQLKKWVKNLLKADKSRKREQTIEEIETKITGDEANPFGTQQNPLSQQAKTYLNEILNQHSTVLTSTRETSTKWGSVFLGGAMGVSAGPYCGAVAYVFFTGAAFSLGSTPVGWIIAGSLVLFAIGALVAWGSYRVASNSNSNNRIVNDEVRKFEEKNSSEQFNQQFRAILQRELAPILRQQEKQQQQLDGLSKQADALKDTAENSKGLLGIIERDLKTTKTWIEQLVNTKPSTKPKEHSKDNKANSFTGTSSPPL